MENRVPNRGSKLLGRADQAKVSLADQVLKDHPASHVVEGDLDDQSQVGLNHPRSRIEVASGYRLGQSTLFRRGQQRFVLDLSKIGLKGIRHFAVLRPGVAHRRIFLALGGKWGRPMTSMSIRATSVHEEVTEEKRSFPEDFVLKSRPEAVTS